jgi:hypothetical protein
MDRGCLALTGSVILIDGKLGGLKAPARSGYAAFFFYDGNECEAVHTFDIDGDIPFDVEVVDHICLHNPDPRHYPTVGTIFLLREDPDGLRWKRKGPFVVGYGEVICVDTPVGDVNAS